MPRALLHADLDAFFASVEQLDAPELRGRPVVVGGPPEARGVVAAASYEARRFGVHSAQPMVVALRRCPGAIRVEPRFSRYRELSGQVMALFRALTPLVEPLSLDEAYLDLSERLPRPDFASLSEAAAALKRQVREATGLTLSVGAGATKTVAKIASDLGKPDGLVVAPIGEERAFLAPLPVGRLWGVGPKAEARLGQIGVRTIGDLSALDPTLLNRRFGAWGARLHELACGIDPRPVVAERETKSVGRETTFARDSDDPAFLQRHLEELARAVAASLVRHNLAGRTVTLKLRDSAFQTYNRQVTLAAPIDQAERIAECASALLRVEQAAGRAYRLIGVSVSRFAEARQLALPL